MWWLVASALADDRVLYATDWTSGVDGASRSKVAQLIQAHEHELLSCLAAGDDLAAHLRFRWDSGKAVAIEVTADSAAETCLATEISRWRSAVSSKGPYVWELSVDGADAARRDDDTADEYSIPDARIGENGRLIAFRANIFERRLADPELNRTLNHAMPSFAACLEGSTVADLVITWIVRDGMLDSGRIARATGVAPAEATCLVNAAMGVPYDGPAWAVRVRFLALGHGGSVPELLAPAR